MLSRILKIIALTAAIGVSSPSFAQFYAGGSVGQSKWDDVRDSTGTSYDIFGGFQFSEYLAAEIAFTDAGSFDSESKGDTFGTNITGANYSLVLLLPLDDGINIKAKVSYLDYELEREINSDSRYKIQNGNLNYAVGLDVNAGDNLYFLLEYRYYPLDFTHDGEKSELAADNLSLGLRFDF